MKQREVLLLGLLGAVLLYVYSKKNIASNSSAGLSDLINSALNSNILQTVSDSVSQVEAGVMKAVGIRGIRNNNPGNIRHSATKWQGMSAQQTDANFVQFISPEYGIRALSKLMDTYYNNHGLKTVRAIISRYAPASENNTNAYASAIAGALGISPDVYFDLASKKQDLVAAIIKHENGLQPYTIAQINTGVTMA